MPSFKLIGGFLAIVAFVALLAAVRAQGYSEAEAKGEARYNALIAQHAQSVADAVASARDEEQAAAKERAAVVMASVERVEARKAALLKTATAQLRSLQEAADADPAFDACLRLPLPDGLRVEPTPP